MRAFPLQQFAVAELWEPRLSLHKDAKGVA
jgi:hypothetical protein